MSVSDTSEFNKNSSVILNVADLIDRDISLYQQKLQNLIETNITLSTSSSSDLKVQSSNSQIGINELNSTSTVTTDYKNPSLECLVYTPDTQNLIFADNLKSVYLEQLSYLSKLNIKYFNQKISNKNVLILFYFYS